LIAIHVAHRRSALAAISETGSKFQYALACYDDHIASLVPIMPTSA
jgi:hypothetical protein